VGRAAELDDDLGRPTRHGLSAAQVKWHTLPAPVVDMELQGRERRGLTFGGNSLFIVIAVILATERVVGEIGVGQRPKRPQDLDLLVTDQLRFVSSWRLHRRDGHQLLRHRESYAVIGATLAIGLVLAELYHLAAGKGFANLPTALLEGLFAGSSLISTTGFHVREESFSVLPLAVLFLCALVGGGAMSTAGGLKMFRIGVLLRQGERELSKSLFPHGVKTTRAGGHIWIDDDVRGIYAMVVASVLVLAFTSTGLALAGLPFAPATAAALAAFSNIGPLYGAGPIAGEPWPALSGLPAHGLGFLGIAMVAGRIEVLALFGVLNIAYWRNR
jgi:Trk-type K+ transport system membrane component